MWEILGLLVVARYTADEYFDSEFGSFDYTRLDSSQSSYYEEPNILRKEVQISNFVNGIVDSLQSGLLDGRPAGNSFLLTSHQLQQLQQQLQAAAVATASQQQTTEQVATASGGLTLALHHTAAGASGVLAHQLPQLLLTSQAGPSFAAYPHTTTSIQQVLQHHVRQSSILQSTIQQVGSQQTQQQSFTETSNGILNGNSKCIPVSPASPFSSRSLTPSPQQRVLTPQPVFQQVMNATVPVLQLYQPATRTATVTAASIPPQPKNKPPQQILPKPITNIMTQTTIKPQPQQTSTQAGTLLINQMIPNTGVLVGQQASNGVQLILKSPSPQSISTSVPKAQVVVSSNSSLTQSPNTVFVQANRTQPQQVVRLITGQSLQLQQVQTSSGPAFVAVPSIQQATLQQTSSTQPATVVPSVTTVPVQTSVFNQNVIKKTNQINASCISHQINVNSASNTKKKKRKEEEPTKLDLANLIKISGIDEEDVAITPTSMASSSSLSSLSSGSSSVQSSPTSGMVQISSPCAFAQNQRAQVESQSHQITFHQEQHQCQPTNQLKAQQFASSRPPTPKQSNATVVQQIQQTSSPQCGLRFSIGEDGQVILHQPQITSQSVTASVAAAAQTQLAQLVAEHGNNIVQTAVLSLTGSESIVIKTPTGFARLPPQMVLQRTAPNVVLTSDPTTARILTDVSAINGLTGKVQLVSSNTIQDHNRVQIVNPGTMSLTEQQRVQIVTAAGMPDLSSMSLTTEQQNHVQILTNVPSATAAEVSLTEQQQNHRMEIISNVPNSSTTTVNEQKSRIQVIPSTRTVSVTEQLVSDISQQILTNVPNASNIHEQNTRLIFQNSERNNEQLHISSSERTDVHITANTIPEALANQQTKLQMIANLPQNCAISLNEQNRFHIIPSGEFATIDDKNEIHKLEHQLHVDSQDAQHLRADNQQQQQRFHLISSNLEEQQRFMQVNEEQNRIIVEHQRVLNTSTMAFNEAQNRVQVVANPSAVTAGISEQQRLLQQLDEQRKIQIIASLPQQQCIMQLNEQQNKVTLKNIDNLEQLQQSFQQQQQQQQRLVASQQNAQSKMDTMKDGSSVHKTSNQHHQIHHMTSLDSSFHDKLPEHLNSELLASVMAAANDDNATKLNNQNLLHRMNVTASAPAIDSIKNRSVTFDVRTHQTCKPSPRGNILCPTSSSSVISPRCTPSPHSPFASGKSPSHLSPQLSPAVACSTAGIISPSCFSNRPNLTVVTQSSPPTSSSALTPASSSTSLANQNAELTLNHMQVKPCAAVISHSNAGNVSAILCNQQQMIDSCGGGNRFVAQSLSSPSLGQCNTSTSPPPLSLNAQQLQQHQQLQQLQLQQQQNLQQVSGCPTSGTTTMTMVSIQNNPNSSFLDSIAQPPPHNPLVNVNKAIVSPCSKASVIKPKPKKKSAVVKPMVFQSEDKEKCDEGPACLNPMANNGSHSNVVQRVQTIQLTPQKQQCLKHVQIQINELSSKKTRTNAEQATLQKLFNEQQNILRSGKIIPTVNGQNTQGLTFVSTPVRLVPPPSTPPSPLPPSTPPTCNKATSPLHVQVGTQTTLDEPVAIAAPPTPSPPVPVPTPPPPAVALPTPPLPPPPREPTPPLPSPSPPPSPVPILTPAQRATLITEQLEIDQLAVTQPDTNTPFDSINDACMRLLKYHCFDEPVLSEKDLEKADEIFEATAKHLLDKNGQMLHKYSYLLCKESMREVQTSELIMLNRLFVADETQLLEQMKIELNTNSNPLTTSSIATQVDDVSSPPPTLHEELPSLDPCPAACEFEAFMNSPPQFENHQKPKRPIDESVVEHDDDSCGPESKKHCPDHEELNAQVQSAIDSILNLQRSDPATDEAVRSILPS